MSSCALRPREKKLGRLSVDDSGATLSIHVGKNEYKTDGMEAVLAGSVACGKTVVHLTDEELDWIYLHAS